MPPRVPKGMLSSCIFWELSVLLMYTLSVGEFQYPTAIREIFVAAVT